MFTNIRTPLVAAAALMVLAAPAQAALVELSVNGGFETGDFTGWSQFPSGGTTQSVVTTNPSSGTYAGNLNIPVGTGPINNVLKQANLAEGLLVSGQAITVSFDIRGEVGEGGVLFAENFSEIAGGGVSNNDLINVTGDINANSSVWTNVSYTTFLGAGDVSGGYTLQFAAVCGAVADCFADIYIDNVSIQADVVPIPAAVWLFGTALGMLGWTKKRRTA